MDYSVIDDSTASVGNLDQLTKDLTEAVAGGASNDAKAAAAPSEKKARPDWVPAKFWDEEKGEVLTEKMAQSYTNLESSHGRMANDLGTQRKLTDRLLDLKRADDLHANGGSPEPAKPKLPDVKGTELLDDPAGVINRVVETVVQHRDQQTAQQQQQELAKQRFERFVADHPDYQDTANSAEFAEWVNASPTRKRLSQVAAQGNVDAADDLLVEYKGRGKQVTDPKATADAAALEAARKVGLENGGGNSSQGTTKGKTYRRVDLLLLSQQRPDVYYDEGFQKEIIAAYNEGRVK